MIASFLKIGFSIYCVPGLIGPFNVVEGYKFYEGMGTWE